MNTTVAPQPRPPKRPRISRTRLFREILEDRLQTPMTVQEAGKVLDVSRRTVLSWLEARLLLEAPSSRPSKRLLDTAGVYGVRQVLDRVRQQSPRRHGGDWFRRLAEEIFWEAHPGDREALLRSADQARRGEVEPFDDDAVEAARDRRASRQ